MNALPTRFLSRALRAAFVAVSLAAAPVGLFAASFTLIHTFDPLADGNIPYPALVQGADGRFYGVNSTGGRSNNGTIFALDVNGGGFTVLNTFNQPGQGTTPQGGLVQGRDGNFYGTANKGGANGVGTLYQVVPTTGKLNILAQFNNGDPGANPVGTLTEGLDGLLYGTAQFGGVDNFGTVFQASESSSALNTFATITGGLAGLYPQSDLIQALDGNFYGTTLQGGTANVGSFFQVTPGGIYTTLYSFTGFTDGSGPRRGVVQGPDGAFYGTATSGGTGGAGTIFRLAVSGGTATFTAIHNFQPTIGDGATPNAGLLLAGDGNFYGTTSSGGPNLAGTIYEVTPSGGYFQLYSFNGTSDSGFPVGGLTQGGDGRLFGTAAGQNGSAGAVFRLDNGLAAPAPAPQLVLAASASVGDTVLIKGNYFVGATAVAFTGPNVTALPAASFNVFSRTIIQAVVPAGAVTGSVSVTANAQTRFTPVALTVNTPAPTPTPTPTPAPAPVVTVTAIQPAASRADGTAGRFKVARTGDTSAALAVNFKVPAKSTAVLGTDYALTTKGTSLGTSGAISIPAGKASVAVKVVPAVRPAAPPASVFLKLKPGGDAYTVGTPFSADVLITSPGQ